MGLRFWVWSGPRVRRMVNALGLGLGLWSGRRLLRMVNGLRLVLGARLMVWA